MHFPIAWDPYFKDIMTVADVYDYPTQHYDHHRRQLTTRRDPRDLNEGPVSRTVICSDRPRAQIAQ